MPESEVDRTGIPVSPSGGTRHGHHHLVQAPIQPLDEDGVNVAITGTVAFGLGAVVLLLGADRLLPGGERWWIWVTVVGTVIGLVGIGYCLRRRRLRSIAATEDS